MLLTSLTNFVRTANWVEWSSTESASSHGITVLPDGTSNPRSVHRVPFIDRSTHLQRLPASSEPSAVWCLTVLPTWPEKVIVFVSITSATKLSCLKREPVIIQPQTTRCYNNTYIYEIVLNYRNSTTILIAPAQVSCDYYIPSHSCYLLILLTSHRLTHTEPLTVKLTQCRNLITSHTFLKVKYVLTQPSPTLPSLLLTLHSCGQLFNIPLCTVPVYDMFLCTKASEPFSYTVCTFQS